MANPFSRKEYDKKNPFSFNKTLDNTPQVEADTIKGIPRAFSEVVGQPALRAWSATGAYLAAGPMARARGADTKFYPTTDLQRDLLGTNKPISFRSVGEEVLPEGNPAAPALGVFFGVADAVPGGASARQTTKQGLTALEKLIGAIKGAAKPRAALDAAYTAERAKRVGEVRGVFENSSGQTAYYQALSKLKGELAPDKKMFEPIQVIPSRNIPNVGKNNDAATNDAWPTTASKPSKDGVTSTGSAPTGKEGVSAQRVDTSGPFEEAFSASPFLRDLRTFESDFTTYKTNADTGAFLRSLDQKNPDLLDAIKQDSVRVLEADNVKWLYKAVAKETDETSVAGSFTTDRAYAEQFGKYQLEGDYKIIKIPFDDTAKGRVVFADRNSDIDDMMTRRKISSGDGWYENEVFLRPSPSIPKELDALAKADGGGTPKGEPPFEEAAQAADNAITQADVDDIFDQVRLHKSLTEFEKIQTFSGLQKILQGEIPQPSQLSLMEDVFGKDLIVAIREKRPTIDKVKDIITEVVNLPRTLITSIDMSAVLRQGLLLTASHPVLASKATKEMFRQVFSQENFEKWLADLPNNPRYRMMKDSGLYVSDPTRLSGGLAAREEQFMSNLAERIPLIGAMVRASQRAYISYLNKIRVDTFVQLANRFEAEGIADEANLKSLASFVNNASGRGSLGAFERSAQGLANVFFSPRLIASRFNMLNPVWYAKQTPAVRKEAIKTMATTIAVGSTVLSLAKAGGADVELDPRSTDFGKIRVGNTRWDVWGGFQQWVRVFSQLTSGQRKSTKDGDIIELSKKEYPFQSRFDVGLNFFRGKLAPVPSLMTEILEGQKLFGESITLSDELVENTIPLYLQDIVHVTDDVGPEAIFNAALPAFFGVGLQHYQERTPTTVNNPFNR